VCYLNDESSFWLLFFCLFVDFETNMDFLNFGLQQLNNGTLDNMLQGAGVSDVGSFVNQFRQQAGVTKNQSINNKFCFFVWKKNAAAAGDGGNNSADMIQGAINAYKTFSGGNSGSGGSGNFLDNIGRQKLIWINRQTKYIYVFFSFVKVRLIKMHNKLMLSTKNSIEMATEK